MPAILSTTDADFEERFRALLASKREDATDVDDAVAAILRDVRAEGDAALMRYTKRFDRLDLSRIGLRVSEDEIDAALAAAPPAEVDALRLAAERIRAYHARQMPDDAMWTDPDGARLGWRWTPVDAAGLYVPGGLASYPSSVLMNAVPARAAGVGRLVMCVPAPDGVLNPLVLAAARLSGVDEVYRVGGAQAVGAMAYGTETIRAVDVVTGPGNAYVAAAKRQVFGRVGIDMIAGPSEVLIVADRTADPDWIALDLLSQAEHDASAQAILVTDDAGLASATEEAVERHLAGLDRTDVAGAAWRDFGAVVTVRDMDEAVGLADRIAAEHLELMVEDPDGLAARIRHAGAIFLGSWTPEAVGDYVGGPNHVLPTARSARFSSGLSVMDFLKRTTLTAMTPEALRAIGPAAVTLAASEGLGAHGASVAARLERLNR